MRAGNKLKIGRINRKTFTILFLLVMVAYLIVQPLGFGNSFGQGTNDLLSDYSQIELQPSNYLLNLSGFYHASPLSALIWSIFSYGLLVTAYILCIGRLHDMGKSGWHAIYWIIVIMLMATPVAYIAFIIPPFWMILLVFFLPLLFSLRSGQKVTNKYGIPKEPQKMGKAFYGVSLILLVLLFILVVLVKNIQVQNESQMLKDNNYESHESWLNFFLPSYIVPHS